MNKKRVFFTFILVLLILSLIIPIINAEDSFLGDSIDLTGQEFQNQQYAYPAYLYSDYGTNPTTMMPWYNDYCNETGGDFIIQTIPGSCEPGIVRSDLLEETNVPVFCRLTAIKINPLIQVPYIKRIDVVTENKSKEILDVGFLPARTAFSYYAYNQRSPSNELEGIPSMNNLGYIMIRLKQQPDESKMPESVIANLTARITYDVSRSYGVEENKITLKKMSDSEWNQNYKKYGFWRGRGYLRLIDMDGLNQAKIALYTSPGNPPIFSQTLSPGTTTDQINLPGFYCSAGPSLKLEKISKPETKARLILNGNEVVLANNEELLDSECRIASIDPSNFSYTGKIKIRCMGKSETLSLNELQAELSIDGNTNSYSLGDEIQIGDEYYYIGYAGREYFQSESLLKSTDYVILYGGRTTQISEEIREKISTAINDIAITRKEDGRRLSNLPDSIIKEKIKEINRRLDPGDIKVIGKSDSANLNGKQISLINVLGEIEPSYPNEIEKYYKEAMQQYRDIAYAYSEIEHPEGSYYSLVALRNAAELARFFDKRKDQISLLLQVIDKYADSTNPEIQREIESIRMDISKLTGAGGKSSTVLVTNQGTYHVQLISVERPGLNTLLAEIEVNNTKETLTLNDRVDEWYVESIEEDSVTFKKIGDNDLETITPGEVEFLGKTRVSLLRTEINLEATVSVLPFESNRVTEANFSVAVGIEKREIQLAPNKIKDLIEGLETTLDALNNFNEKLGETVSTWKKVCFIGGGILWAKNFVTGLSGESSARREVMQRWKDLCGSEEYRNELSKEKYGEIRQMSSSHCYKLREDEIKADIGVYKEALEKTNDFIKKVKDRPDVISTGGLFGSSKFINENKFMEQAQEVFKNQKELNINVQSSEENKKDINTYQIGERIFELYEAGKLYRAHLREIILDIYLKKACGTSKVAEKSGICESIDLKLYVELEPLYLEGPSGKTLAESENLIEIKDALESSYASQTIGEVSAIERPVWGPTKICEENVEYTIAPTLRGETILILEDTGKEYYQIKKAYTFKKTIENGKEDWNINCVEVIEGASGNNRTQQLKEILGIENMFIVPVDPKACTNNRIKDPEIKFWESGPYEGLPALMPIKRSSGWYLATKSYTGFENDLVSWTESGNLNTFWICNVGQNGKVDFDFNKGPTGDDAKCCREISLPIGNIIIPPFDESASKNLIDQAKSCAANAKEEYSKGKKTIDTGECESYKLGIPPSSVPSLECEDFMSPGDCQILYNLCDPVICPASRCNFGGRYNTENVISEGIIGSLVLCLPNAREGIIFPVCLTGLHAGLDAFTKVLEAYRNCLRENLESGQTVGICDQSMSIYLCEFFWKQLNPLLKNGIPAITEKITNSGGGGEYSQFSESWNNMIQSLDYFGQVYAPKTLEAFKAKSSQQVGVEVCKNFISVAWPSPGKFLDEISEPESFPQFTANLYEVEKIGPTPESHYKVHYLIYAGKDQGIFYSVYMKNPPIAGYYETPEQYFVPQATGYIPAGEFVDATPDFMAPTGYKEVCIRINSKEYCDFGTVSSSFALDELQNFYLEDQLEDPVTKANECKSGTSSIIPIASLNLQNVLEQGISPELYKQGIVRFCSSKDPGEATGEIDRYQRIGYCDNPDIGCWLDLESVNDTISDLKIRQDVIDESKAKDLAYAIDIEGLDTADATASKLIPIEEEIQEIQIRLTRFLEEVKRKTDLLVGKTSQEIENGMNDIEKDYEEKIEKEKKEINSLERETIKILDKSYDFSMKARAEEDISKLKDMKAKFVGAIKVMHLGLSKSELEREESGTTQIDYDSIPIFKKNLGEWYAINYDDLKEPRRFYVTVFGGPNDKEGSDTSCGVSTNEINHYAAIRYNYQEYPTSFWCDKMIRLTNPETKKYIDVPLVDFGPSIFVTEDAGGQVIDISPQTLNFLRGINSASRFEHVDLIVQWTEYAKKYNYIGGVKANFAWPVKNFGKITSYFRSDSRPNHEGIDIAAEKGTEVKAFYDGTVVYIQENCNCQGDNAKECGGKYGNYVVLRHEINNKKVYSLYAHLDKVYTNQGASVDKGEKIGEVGNTGNACEGEPHLHFETHIYDSNRASNEANPNNHFEPLCFFSNSILLDAGYDSNEYSESECREVKERLGIDETTATTTPTENCEDLSEHTCIVKSGCWWDNTENECRKCPEDCDGDPHFLTDLFGRIAFETKDDCEKNTCNLECRWILKENGGECVEGTPNGESIPSLTNGEIILVSSLNNGKFSDDNKIIDYNDNVRICAVLKQDGDYYSQSNLNANIPIEAYVGSIDNIRWYKIIPYGTHVGFSQYPNEKYQNENQNQLWHENYMDIIQYNQIPLGKTSWCIDAETDSGTNWYRVEIEINGQQFSSLGKPANEDKQTLNEAKTFYPSIYFNENSHDGTVEVPSTILEPEAYRLGISRNVHRISRKSNYHLTTCIRNSDYSSTDTECQLIALAESFKNVPFLDASTKTESGSVFQPYDFISIDCVHLASAAIQHLLNKAPYIIDDYEEFIGKDNEILTLNINNQNQQAYKINLNTILGSGISVDKNKEDAIHIGDFIVISEDGQCMLTVIFYEDKGTIGYLDSEDTVLYVSGGCHIQNNNKLCYNKIGRWSSFEGTILRIKK